MTGPEHYRIAETCLATLGERGPDEGSPALLAEAQVHATLALAAATIDAVYIAGDRSDYNPTTETEKAWSAITA